MVLARPLFATLGLLITTALSQNNSTLNFNNCCGSAQDATAFAIAYGTPLVSFENNTATYIQAVGANNVVSAPTLSDPRSQSVVRPNADTPYTLILIDLSQSDLVITIPEINDGRYWVFPFLDPFGNDFADISIVNGSPAGDYLIRRADDAGVSPGLEITTATSSCIPKYAGIVNYPTTYGTFVGRILVLQNTTADLDIVHTYQKGIKITTTPRALSNNLTQAPPLTKSLVDTSNITAPALKALALLARLGQYNQPEVAADRYRVGSILGQAGISNGVYRQPAGVDITAAAATADSATASLFKAPSNLVIASNGWVLQNTTVQGNFLTDYASRYQIAITGYLQLPASEALYPSWAPGTLSGESLTAKQAYLFTFYGLPPVDTTKGGFWSLTAYTADQFLVPNGLGRYEVGDRTEGLHYSDGTLLYPQGSAVGSTKSNNATMSSPTMSANYANTTTVCSGSTLTESTRQFQVLLQPADVQPPSNWTANWLPAPSGGGVLSFTLRWYAPTALLTNGQYIYPMVQKVDAITA